MNQRSSSRPVPAPPPSEATGKFLKPRPSATPFSEALCDALATLGVRSAFGLVGGGNAAFVNALGKSPIHVAQFRHEGGAAFAAAEAYFASGAPSVLFTTTGPGVLNSLTGVAAARWDGAKVILVSACTSAPERGRWASQETSALTMPISGLYTDGPLFDYATVVEDARQLDGVVARLALGLTRPQGFVAHIALPIAVQSTPVPIRRDVAIRATQPSASAEVIATCARELHAGSFGIWVGFGARHAGHLVRELAERSGARVFSTPRAKGTIPEDHPLYLGVTGVGGQEAVDQALIAEPPDRILVLGTRMGEGSSFWNPVFQARCGLIHVDLDRSAPGAAYPQLNVLAVQSEIGLFLEALLEHFPASSPPSPSPVRHATAELEPRPGRIRPQYLMQAIQRIVVDRSTATVMAESGNAFGWATQCLRFREPHRYRVSSGFAAMGHFTAGAVGAALAGQVGDRAGTRARRPVAIVGDGAMLMHNELSTAVAHGVDAVWIVLNDARFGIVEQGMKALGFQAVDCAFPEVDFVAVAQGTGARGIRVASELELVAALEGAMAERGPYVVDVLVDPTVPSALLRRVASLIGQGTATGQSGGSAAAR
jgi:acetolactate synthase-1/2/3 large subunit